MGKSGCHGDVNHQIIGESTVASWEIRERNGGVCSWEKIELNFIMKHMEFTHNHGGKIKIRGHKR